jgi:predicted nucleic acid-binding protein
MLVRVVDASALGALVFGEPKAETIASALTNASLVAPALLWFELASICLKKIKAHSSQRTLILKAFNLADRLTIDIVEVNHSAVITLAKETGITTYDASYVWLAKQLKGELVTLDTKMLRVVNRY